MALQPVGHSSGCFHNHRKPSPGNRKPGKPETVCQPLKTIRRDTRLLPPRTTVRRFADEAIGRLGRRKLIIRTAVFAGSCGRRSVTLGLLGITISGGGITVARTWGLPGAQPWLADGRDFLARPASVDFPMDAHSNLCLDKPCVGNGKRCANPEIRPEAGFQVSGKVALAMSRTRCRFGRLSAGQWSCLEG